jgi:hypothetical protein
MPASTKRNFMWQNGTDRVSYVCKEGEQRNTLAVYQALAEASRNNYAANPNSSFRTFGESSAVGMNVTCGLNPLPEWIRSEQSVVVNGLGSNLVHSNRK